jgi:hypothetical protein
MQGYVHATVLRHSISKHIEARLILLAGLDADSARRGVEGDAHRGVRVRG